MSVLKTGALNFLRTNQPRKKRPTHFVSETKPFYPFFSLDVKHTSIISAQGSRPAFDRALNDIAVDEGEKVSLECWVHGKPKPTITWYHNEKKIKNDSDYKQSCKGKHHFSLIRQANFQLKLKLVM